MSELPTTLYLLFLRVLPLSGVLFVTLIAIYITQRFFERRITNRQSHFLHAAILAGIVGLGMFTAILALPVADTTRSHLVTLLGIVVSAIITLSSTTFMGNAMAGLMLRMMSRFRPGDAIQSGEHFGRVTEQGLFHTEIQTRNRNLVTLPNLYLVTQPLTVIRSSGTVVAATVSLGYDVSHQVVDRVLLKAAQDADLSDTFVQITHLGDFSITYRVAGLLTDLARLLSAESNLRTHILDALHEEQIEIVSPNFINQRIFSPDQFFLPDEDSVIPSGWMPVRKDPRGEVIFDKAEQAASLADLRARRNDLADEDLQLRESMSKATDPKEIERAQALVDWNQRRLERIDLAIHEAEQVHKDQK